METFLGIISIAFVIAIIYWVYNFIIWVYYNKEYIINCIKEFCGALATLFFIIIIIVSIKECSNNDVEPIRNSHNECPTSVVNDICTETEIKFPTYNPPTPNSSSEEIKLHIKKYILNLESAVNSNYSNQNALIFSRDKNILTLIAHISHIKNDVDNAIKKGIGEGNLELRKTLKNEREYLVRFEKILMERERKYDIREAKIKEKERHELFENFKLLIWGGFVGWVFSFICTNKKIEESEELSLIGIEYKNKFSKTKIGAFIYQVKFKMIVFCRPYLKEVIISFRKIFFIFLGTLIFLVIIEVIYYLLIHGYY